MNDNGNDEGKFREMLRWNRLIAIHKSSTYPLFPKEVVVVVLNVFFVFVSAWSTYLKKDLSE